MSCYCLIFNLVGLLLNLIGTLIVGLALVKYLKSVDNSFLALEKSIESIANIINNTNQKAFIFQGMEQHRQRGKRREKLFTFIGLMFIILGFTFQLLSTLIQTNCINK